MIQKYEYEFMCRRTGALGGAATEWFAVVDALGADRAAHWFSHFEQAAWAPDGSAEWVDPATGETIGIMRRQEVRRAIRSA